MSDDCDPEVGRRKKSAVGLPGFPAANVVVVPPSKSVVIRLERR